ncbi:MAG TPA: hypothetical protein VMZ53_15330 [Kofleriaceae bacterium]|nr:hypothetical protein [Kofleriaceae bacterium]
MRTPALAALLTLALVPATASARPRPQPADAKAGGGPTGKSAPACGAKVLPLVVGNSWTYTSIAAPLPADEQIKRIAPGQPKKIVVTVKSVDKKDKDTVATLEEKVTVERLKDGKPYDDEYSYESTITCNDKQFDISPGSFFFAGEPGGFFGLEITKTDRPKGTSIQLTKGGIGEAQWGEDLIILWTRKPTEGSGAKLGSGKLELERRFTPQEPEPVTTKQGMYRSEKIGLITTGRVTLDNPGTKELKPMELPANWLTTMWLADGVGVVQTLNMYAHMYQLSEATLK